MSAAKREKLEPRLPRGFADRGPADMRAVDAMMAKIKAVYERYGFEPVETPFVEYTEALGKFLPDQDRPNEGVFSFQDEDESWLSLRYDLTAPLARYVAENYERLPKPYRSYRAGWVFRNEKPGPGRFRQFMQFDADTVGASSPAADAEICMMAADTMEALGFERGQYVIKVGSRKILDALMDSIGLTREEDAGRRLTVMRSIDKLDRLGFDGVSLLLGVLGRLDQSGDRTSGAGLTDAAVDIVLNFLRPVWGAVEPNKNVHRPWSDMDTLEDGRLLDNYGTLAHWTSVVGGTGSGQLAVENLKSLVHNCEAAGFGSKRVRIDPSIVRGLEYYTGPVFEAQLTFEVPNERGEPVVFGSVGGGGRYDGLVGRFRGEDVPATGFSVGVSRLASALKAIGKLGDEGFSGPVVVTVMDRERMGDYQKMVADLRNAGIAAELYLGPSGMKAQLKYADRRNSPAAIIAGSNEFDSGRIQIKDLAAGKAGAAAIGDNQAWRDERPGQFEIPRAEFVARVKELLSRQRSS